MISRKLWVLLLLAITGFSQAQTTEDALKALDYENYATARRTLQELIKKHPEAAVNYYYLGTAYCTFSKIDSARMVLNAGIQADPKSIYNYVGLGRSYLEENNTQMANQNFDKAKSMTSQKDILQYKLMADAYTSAVHPNYDLAITLLNKAITITASKYSEQHLLIEIMDNGPGVPADKVEAIFQAFYTTKTNGVGIGLNICRTMIESNGGRMWAKTDNAGGVFYITLPLANAAADDNL